MDNLYFIIHSKKYGSAIMRGYQICRQLQKEGIHADVIDLNCDYRKAVRIEDSMVIFVKNAILKRFNFATILKNNKNSLIWDVIDTTVEKSDPHPELFEDKIKIFDGIIFPNHQSKLDWTQYAKKDCITDVIYHHWDPRLKSNHAKNFRLAYIGGTENLEDDYIDNVEEMNIVSWSGETKTWNLFRKIAGYNCHFSVTEKSSDSFKYKSNAKLSCASATTSNIILSRNTSFTELLDSSYPYYTNSDLESVKEMVKYSKGTYGTKIWHKALDMIREVREKTSIERICKDYTRYLDRF